MQNIEEIKEKYRSYHELKEEFSKLNISLGTESDQMRKLIDDFKDGDKQQKFAILEDLEYLAHKVDNAIDFVKLSKFNILYKYDCCINSFFS